MGADGSKSETESRQRRLWHFGNATFDETAWTLTVAGQPVILEHKPLALLRVLLERAGDVVGKDDLLEAAWPGVVVVEASLPTAIRKLRKALGDDDRARPAIATVPRIGYRLTVPVRIERLDAEARYLASRAAVPPMIQPTKQRWRELTAAGALLILAGVAVALLYGGWGNQVSGRAAVVAPAPVDMQQAKAAVRRMDLAQLDAMIAAGWDPEAPFDREQNGALNLLLERCEWDPGHDRNAMLMAARALIDGGASLTRRNYWGDTAYSIAKSPRYCGVDHPVTAMIRSLCTNGEGALMPLCEADYVTAKSRRAAMVAEWTGR